MGSDKQIVIVGTGFIESMADYIASDRYHNDRPKYIIDRDGAAMDFFTDSNVIALVNAGPVVQYYGQWMPAHRNGEGKYVPITEDVNYAVRVPYEYCSCKPYFGCQHYEFISDRQMATLKDILRNELQRRSIQFPYDNQLGTVSPRAVAGGSGIYFASSFDRLRSDIHPQIELIHLIKSLAK